jgi:hypothetical protein
MSAGHYSEICRKFFEGTSVHPIRSEFEESSLLVRTIVNTEIADELRDTRSDVISWLCGASLEKS